MIIGGNFGRKLLQQPAPVEYISHNGSMGQPQLHVYDTVEGVPHISFSPTAQGQTASFTGGEFITVVYAWSIQQALSDRRAYLTTSWT